MEKKEQEDVKTKLLQIWVDDIQQCSQFFRTDAYGRAWERFENDIVDVPGVAPFKQMMLAKKEEFTQEGNKCLTLWCSKNPFESKTVEKDQEAERIQQRVNEKLYNFMLGLIMEKMF